MNTAPLELALAELFQWCRQHNFSGHDPFDALNSRLFQATPLKQSRKARFFWTQVLKRSPLNLRKLALIPAEKNSKGIALFSLAALANHRRLKTKESEREARELLNELLALRLQGHSGAAWGYNFDWQSRVFFAPRGTPAIVPTAFAARALLEAAQLFSDEGYLSVARSTCDFILQDLPRSVETAREVCFGYTPSSETRIYNASLLAAEVLAGVGALSGESELCEVSLKAARYVVNQQRSDGSWTYGVEPTQPWVDNFHTAFLLGSLKRITDNCEVARNDDCSGALRRGYEYWRKGFFLADGCPKYYHDTLYPIDTHAAATAIVTQLDLQTLDREALVLAERIALWSIKNLRDPRGFFYYQLWRFHTVRTPFMRWTQAWMLYALARLLEEDSKSR